MDVKVELLLAAVAEALVLTRDQVSAADTFLDLGGDSLAALYVCEDLSGKGLALNAIDLFNGDNLEHVAIGIRPLAT
jgi:hypothetical protein